jgi:hypothetical protein
MLGCNKKDQSREKGSIDGHGKGWQWSVSPKLYCTTQLQILNYRSHNYGLHSYGCHSYGIYTYRICNGNFSKFLLNLFSLYQSISSLACFFELIQTLCFHSCLLTMYTKIHLTDGDEDKYLPIRNCIDEIFFDG